MGDIRYYGGKITITATTSPSGHKIETAQDCVLPDWVTDVVTGETWTGNVNRNEGKDERPLNLKVKVTTNTDPNYEGVTAETREWNLIQETKNTGPQDNDQCEFYMPFGTITSVVAEGCRGYIDGNVSSANDLVYRQPDTLNDYASCGLDGDIQDEIGTMGESFLNFFPLYKDASKIVLDFGVNFSGTTGEDWSCGRVMLEMKFTNTATQQIKNLSQPLIFTVGGGHVSTQVNFSDWFITDGKVNIEQEIKLTFYF